MNRIAAHCCDKCDARQTPEVLGGALCWDENCECHLKKDSEPVVDEFPPVVECPICSGEGGWDVFNFDDDLKEWFVCDRCDGEGVLDEGEDE